MPSSSKKSKVISVRVPYLLLDQIENLYEVYTADLGVRITRAAFITWMLGEGLKVIEQKQQEGEL
jgi:hypothetical protein